MTDVFKPYPFTAKTYPPGQPGNTPEAGAPVVIVGAGPVGLTTALGLARYGVRSILIEADDSVCFGSRAICISRRSLEIIERLGALDGFLKKGLPWVGGRSFYRDAEVLQFTMPQDENQKLPPMINLAQYHIEQYLLDAVEAQSDLIEVRWQTRVTGVIAHADGVDLHLSTPEQEYDLRAAWVVAADGGRSSVRQALGLTLTGTAYEGRYVIVDIELESTRPTERLAYFDPPCNPGSTVLVHRQPDHVWRIDYQLRDDEDPEQAVMLDNVRPRVQSLLQMMGENASWEPIWISLYKANALTLEKYRHGRVLFAGDAAHLVPIFGVRGANSGLDDADNLAWKLAFVFRQWAGEKLLDTYSDERVFAARENLRHGAKSTEFMAPPSFAFELMRTAVLGLAEQHPHVRSLINPRQSSAITYLDSALSSSEDEAVWAAGPASGAVLPECPLMRYGDGGPQAGHVTDLLGLGFTLLYFNEDGVAPAALAQACRGTAMRGVPVQVEAIARAQDCAAAQAQAWDADGRLFAMYGASEGTAYLVRPDGHVAARWQVCQPPDVVHAVSQALAWGGPV